MSEKRKFIASLETSVPVGRSADQIRQLVERFGAVEYGLQYDPVSGLPVAVSFKVKDPETGMILPVALRAPSETIYKALRSANWRSDNERCRQQADRVAWRNLHDFVRASLIGVQTGIMTLGEAFLASVIVELPTGEAKRFGELIAEGQFLTPDTKSGKLMLGSGSR